MRALLVRVGADVTKAGGGWNGPVNPKTWEFVYVPIPETYRQHRRMRRPYTLVIPALAQFGRKLPGRLRQRTMHLDPDFAELTYGDSNQRAVQIRQKLRRGDLIVFYAGLRAVPRQRRLVYALIGIYVIASIRSADEIPKREWDRNAHTRRVRSPRKQDVIVMGKPSLSGRFESCISIGSFRQKAYRVTLDLIRRWGGLTVKDGYLQRSARLPEFCDAGRFYSWFKKQRVRLLRHNH